MMANYGPSATNTNATPDGGAQPAGAVGKPGEARPDSGLTDPARRDEVVQVGEKVADKANADAAQGVPPNETVRQLQQTLGPAPQLDNVLTVHGLFSDGKAFDTMSQYWTADGTNRMGGTIQGRDLAGLSTDDIRAMQPADLARRLGLNAEGNIFNMEFSGNAGSTDRNREELARAVEVVSRLRNGGQVDLVAHSKGGVDARNLLDSGATDRVRSLTMLGTPNRGSTVASMAQTGAGDWAARNFMDTPRTEPGRPALNELSPGSSTEQRLNSRWREQLGRLERGAMTIAGAGMLGLGDGIVPFDSAQMPGAINRTAWGSNHMNITESPSVIREVTGFLSGRGLSADQNLYDGTGGRALHSLSNGWDNTTWAVQQTGDFIASNARSAWSYLTGAAN
ncbi:MAG: hypothetical protein AB1758_10505 [Candidatus Eremiobacterota bacterium]